MSVTQSPPPDASGTARGLVSLIAQSFAGVKTFLSAVVMSAGLTLNGTINQMMKVVPPSTVSGQNFDNPTMWFQLTALNQTNLLQFGTGLTSTTWEFALGWYGAAGAPAIISRAGPILIGLASGTSMSPFTPDVADLGSTGNFWRRIYASQGLWIPGTITDLTASPGTTGTINAPKGRASISSASTTFTMSNSLVTANSVVLIEWEDDPGQRHRVVPSAGQFVVTLAAGAAAASKFRFFVVG